MTKQIKDIFKPLVDNIFKMLSVCTIGTIVEYNKSNHLAKVKPMLSTVDSKTETTRQLQPEKKVQVYQLGNPTQRLRFPPQTGDLVIMFSTDLSLEEWLESNGLISVAVKSKVRHHTSHAIAFYLGGTPKQWQESGQRPDIVELVSSFPFWIGSEEVNLVSEFIKLANQVNTLIQLLQGDVNYQGRASSTKLVHILTDLSQAQSDVEEIISNVESIEGT